MGDAADDLYDSIMRKLLDFTDVHGNAYHVDPRLRRQLVAIEREHNMTKLRHLVEKHGVFLKFGSGVSRRRRSD